jgi:HlyD family secretion protein
MRTWLIRIGVLVAIVAAILVLRATVFAPDPLEVRVRVVQPGLVEETVTNSRAGTIKARRRASLSSEVGGQVVELPFREGDQVTAGDVVLRLDDSLQQARLVLSRRERDTARAEQNRSCVAADRAQREYERVARLAAEKIVSVDLLDQSESAHATARAACEAAGTEVARAAASVSLSQIELSKTVLKAPFDAVIAEVSVEVGEWTTPSPPGIPMPAVLDILDATSIFISAPMDEVDSASIRVGLSTRVTVDSHRGREFPGRVTRVAPYVLDVQEQNRTLEVEVELDDAGIISELLPGTSADIEVILSAKNDVLRIPTNALMEGSRVFLLVGGVLEQRDLEIGIRNWNFTEVVSGLSAGDQVVVSLDNPDIEDGAEAVLVVDDDDR